MSPISTQGEACNQDFFSTPHRVTMSPAGSLRMYLWACPGYGGWAE